MTLDHGHAMNGDDIRLGRLPNFDERSRAYPIRALFGAVLPRPRSYTWTCAPVLNQGNTGSCVGHAFAHEIAARPVVSPVSSGLAFDIYRRAQETDPWPDTPPVEGTSVLDGAKACKEYGYYSEYRWAFTAEEALVTIGYKGPVVIGINWYESMFNPEASGHLVVSGSIAGGHAILANAIWVRWPASVRVADRTYANLDKHQSAVTLHNSWGENWGRHGEAELRLEDFERLLSEAGEACIPLRLAHK